MAIGILHLGAADFADPLVQGLPQPGLALGRAHDLLVRIDPTAQGLGWFVDPTPGDDAEFEFEDLDGAANRILFDDDSDPPGSAR